MENYIKAELLQRGAHAAVYCCADKRYITKQCNSVKHYDNELAVYKWLGNRRWLPTLIDAEYPNIVLSKADKDLFTVMDDTTLTFDYKLHLCGQLAIAIDELHSSHVTHGDIKPENVLVDNHTVKLCDFSVACIGDDQRVACDGTCGYISPALGRTNYVGPQLDDWAYAVTLIEVLSGISFVPDEEPSLLDSLYESQLTDDPLTNTEIAVSKQLEFESKWVGYPLSWRLIGCGWKDNIAVKINNIMRDTLLGEAPIAAIKLFELVRELFI